MRRERFPLTVGGGLGRDCLGSMVSCAQRTGARGQRPLLSPPQITYGHFSPNRVCYRRPVDRPSSEALWGPNKYVTEPRSAAGAHGPP